MSFVSSLKCVLVTYYDVRCAQKVLLSMAGRTGPFPPELHDCRVVLVKMAPLLEKVPDMATNGGFSQFGEIAHISMSGGEALVEFYDMRAAQMLLATAGGAASPWLPSGSAAQGFPGVGGGCGLAGQFVASTTGFGAAGVDVPSVGTPVPPAAEAALLHCIQSGHSAPTQSGDSPTNGTPTNDVVEKPRQADRMNNRPVRAKITNKDFQKYDIDAEKIQRGEDPRTTVMSEILRGQTHVRSS
jgi:hypothetical protein